MTLAVNTSKFAFFYLVLTSVRISKITKHLFSMVYMKIKIKFDQISHLAFFYSKFPPFFNNNNKKGSSACILLPLKHSNYNKKKNQERRLNQIQ